MWSTRMYLYACAMEHDCILCVCMCVCVRVCVSCIAGLGTLLSCFMCVWQIITIKLLLWISLLPSRETILNGKLIPRHSLICWITLSPHVCYINYYKYTCTYTCSTHAVHMQYMCHYISEPEITTIISLDVCLHKHSKNWSDFVLDNNT